MNISSIMTFFASPERSSAKELTESKRVIDSEKLFKKTLDALPQILMILNGNRQIIYQNPALLKIIGMTDERNILGMRPGEVLNCIHVPDGPSGCGTSKFCQACGMAQSILKTQSENAASSGELHLTDKNSLNAKDFRVATRYIEIENEKFTLLILSDISDEKQKNALERLFFHDVLNIAGGIQGASSMLSVNIAPEKAKTLTDMLTAASNALIDEIKAQQQLMKAENGELEVCFELIDANRIMTELERIYTAHEVAEGKHINIIPLSGNPVFQSDRKLVIRVLGNMLKNALEATSKDGYVKISAELTKNDTEIEFKVNNSGEMTLDSQLQVFQKSFSTKGSGRGLGTYSIRLLGEKYLRGHVGFTSDKNNGTTFFISLPKEHTA